MKTLLSLVMGVALLAALPCNAEVKVEEQVLGTAGKWVGCAVSPRGAHVAALAMRGSRNVILIDGVEGPSFDQLLDDLGRPSGVATDGTEIHRDKFIPVVFSDDGLHCAYFARIGSEYILVLDGKELVRGKLNGGSAPVDVLRLSFSPRGKHLYYVEGGVGGRRVVMDGKPEPWTRELPRVVFSLDDAHYAYAGSQKDGAGNITRWGILDGRQVKYFGDRTYFTANGHVVSVMLDEGKGGYMLLFDGKSVMEAASIQIAWIFPAGDQIAALVRPKANDSPILTINGKLIPGTENVEIINVYFSPDGKHYAAVCAGANGTFVFSDGKKGQEYHSIDCSRFENTVNKDRVLLAERCPGSILPSQLFDTVESDSEPRFTPDSSKFVYVARNGGKSFIVVNDEESDGFDYAWGPFVGGRARIAYTTMTKQNGNTRNPNSYDVSVDGKMLSPSRTASLLGAVKFTLDGTHFAFVYGTDNVSDRHLVVDGTDIGVSVTRTADSTAVRPVYFLFSHDGKHLAYFGVDLKNKRRGIWVDQKLASPPMDVSGRMTFTPDSEHLIWFEIDAPKGRQTLCVDGQRSVNFPNSAFDTMPGGWEMGADGVLTFLTLEEGSIKRYRVTPSSDTSIAALLSGAPAAEPTKAVADKPATNAAKAQNDADAKPAPPPAINRSSQETRSTPAAPPPVAPQTAEVKLLDPATLVNDCMLVNRDARNAIHTQPKPGVFDQRYRGQRVNYSGIVDAVKKVEGFVVFKGAGKWPENYHVEAVFPPDKMSVLDKLQKGQRLGIEAEVTGFTLPQMDTGIPGIMGPSRTIKLSVVTVLDQ